MPNGLDDLKTARQQRGGQSSRPVMPPKRPKPPPYPETAGDQEAAAESQDDADLADALGDQTPPNTESATPAPADDHHESSSKELPGRPGARAPAREPTPNVSASAAAQRRLGATRMTWTREAKEIRSLLTAALAAQRKAESRVAELRAIIADGSTSAADLREIVDRVATDTGADPVELVRLAGIRVGRPSRTA